MSDLVQDIIAIIRRGRYDLTHEKTTQVQMDAWLKRNGYTLNREYHIEGDIPDFFHQGIAIEVKIKGDKRKIYEQCVRYCKFDEVKVLVLCSNKSLGFPAEINGKPCYYIHLGKAWL